MTYMLFWLYKTYAGTAFAGGSGTHGNDGGVLGADVTFSNGLIVTHQDSQRLATVNVRVTCCSLVDAALTALQTQSNTVALFSINPDDPSELTMLGNPVPSGGDYPNSLTFNKAGDMLCVLNAGTNGTILCATRFTVTRILSKLISDVLRCYDVTYSGLSAQEDSIRTLPNYNQTTPPTGPSNTAGAIAFTPDEQNIVVAIKGTVSPPSPGFLAVWPIEDDGSLAFDPTIVANPSPAGDLAFSLTPIPGHNAFLSADFLSAVDVFDMDGGVDNASGASGTTSRVIDGGLSLCWSTYSPTLDRFYLASPPQSLVVEVTVDENLQTTIIGVRTPGIVSRFCVLTSTFAEPQPPHRRAKHGSCRCNHQWQGVRGVVWIHCS
jgi:hypothetical protein